MSALVFGRHTCKSQTAFRACSKALYNKSIGTLAPVCGTQRKPDRTSRGLEQKQALPGSSIFEMEERREWEKQKAFRFKHGWLEPIDRPHFNRERRAAAVVDLHTHILPKMDDGSGAVGTSLAMLRREAEQGVDAVCATSHYYAHHEGIGAFCARRAEALERLTSALTDDLPRVLPAAEVAYFSHMEEQDLEPLCIRGTRTLMLEMPFTDWTDLQVETVEALVLDCRYQVVLVHPERFCFSKSNLHQLERLAQLPIGLQVNAGALLRWGTRRLALDLLQLTGTPLLGSDCHNLTSRPPNLKEGRKVIMQKLGEAFLTRMDQNAQRLTSSAVEAS